MRGSLPHTWMANRFVEAALSLEATASREVSVGIPGRSGAVDLVVTGPTGRRLGIEFELAVSARQIHWASIKLAQVADVGWIVVPRDVLRVRVERILEAWERELGVRPPVISLTYAVALKQLPFFVEVEGGER